MPDRQVHSFAFVEASWNAGLRSVRSHQTMARKAQVSESGSSLRGDAQTGLLSPTAPSDEH